MEGKQSLPDHTMRKSNVYDAEECMYRGDESCVLRFDEVMIAAIGIRSCAGKLRYNSSRSGCTDPTWFASSSSLAVVIDYTGAAPLFQVINDKR